MARILRHTIRGAVIEAPNNRMYIHVGGDPFRQAVYINRNVPELLLKRRINNITKLNGGLR